MLTWATVAAAVASALWLAVVELEQGYALQWSASPGAGLSLVWPGETTAAGTAPRARPKR